MQFGVNKNLNFFQRLHIAHALRARAILLSLNMLLNTKLHSKSCYYLYYRKSFLFGAFMVGIKYIHLARSNVVSLVHLKVRGLQDFLM